LSVSKAGIATGIVYLFGGVAGGSIAGFLGDRIVKKSQNGRLQIAALISLIGVPFAYFGVIQGAGSLALSVALLMVCYGALNTYYGLVYSSIQDIVAPSQRGTTMAVYFMAMYLCGASFGPVLTGKLSDLAARRAMQAAGATKMTEAFRAIGLQEAMVIIPVLSIGLALVLYMASRTIIADIARREERGRAVTA
jgi:MFS family permease